MSMRTPGRDFRSALIAAVLTMEERCGALPRMTIGVDLYPSLISGELMGPEFIDELRSGSLLGCKADVVPGDSVLLLEGTDPATGETIHLRALLDLDNKRAVFQSDTDLYPDMHPGGMEQMSPDVPEEILRGCFVDVIAKLQQLTGAVPRIKVGHEFMDLCQRGGLGTGLQKATSLRQLLGIQMCVEPVGPRIIFWGVRQGQEVAVSMLVLPDGTLQWDVHGI